MRVEVGQILKFKEFSEHDRRGNYRSSWAMTPGNSYKVIDVYPNHEKYGTLVRVVADDNLKTWLSLDSFAKQLERNLPAWF